MCRPIKISGTIEPLWGESTGALSVGDITHRYDIRFDEMPVVPVQPRIMYIRELGETIRLPEITTIHEVKKIMAKAHRYTLPDLFFACTVEDGGLLPSNATYDALPPKPWGREWPKKKADTGWEMIEDHRERKAPYFPEDVEQEGTPYWLPDDTHDSQPRITKDAGPLPEGALLERPEKPLSVAQKEKRREISTAHERALSGAVALSDPTPSTVAIESSLLAVSDAEGLEYVRDQLATRRAALEAAVQSAATVANVEAIVVSFAV